MNIRRLLFLLALFIIQPKAWAGNPSAIGPDGKPVSWNTSTTIKYKIDDSHLGKLTPAQSAALVNLALSQWEQVEGTGIDFEFLGTERIGADHPMFSSLRALRRRERSGDLIRDYVDEAVSPAPVSSLTATDSSYILIAFDNTGDILERITGNPDQPGVTWLTFSPNSSYYQYPQLVVINGKYFDGDASTPDIYLSDLLSVIVHEVGHALGLDHSTTNFEIFRSSFWLGSRPRDEMRYVPTMNPFVSKGLGQYMVTLHPDDIATLQWIYRRPRTSKLSGKVMDSDGKEIFSTQVTARSTQSPVCLAFSQISGATCSVRNQGICSSASGGGRYVIPVAGDGSYAVEVGEVDLFFGAYSIGTFFENAYPKRLSGGAEFYGLAESSSDSPYQLDWIAAVSDVSGLDMILNGNESMPLSDDLLVRIDPYYLKQVSVEDPQIASDLCPVEYAYSIADTIGAPEVASDEKGPRQAGPQMPSPVDNPEDSQETPVIPGVDLESPSGQNGDDGSRPPIDGTSGAENEDNNGNQDQPAADGNGEGSGGSGAGGGCSLVGFSTAKAAHSEVMVMFLALALTLAGFRWRRSGSPKETGHSN